MLPSRRSDWVPLQGSRAAAKDGLAALSKVLADPDPRVRRLALDTVAEFEEEKASQLILAALNDPDPSVRSAAASAAGRARAFSTVFSLILSLEDPELEVRQMSKQAIEIITGEDVDLDPAADADLREPKIEELKRWWKEQRMAQLANRFESESS